jgi:hypothetical protein
MKKIIFILTVAFAVSCSNSPQQEAAKIDYRSFGKKIEANDAVTNADLEELMEGKDSVFVKIKGAVSSICQKKGCWMNMQVKGGDELFTKFKDYDFFVPMNAAGDTAIMEGWLKVTTTSVEELKHYAHDAEKSEEEIAAITEPERDFAFLADGVLMYKP